MARTTTHDRPRKRPVQARSLATVEALLAATARVLVRRGYAGMTTNHVAARAGVSVGSLYEYFPNKDALVSALLERHLSRAEQALAEVAQALLAGGRPPRRVVLARALAEVMIALHEDDPRLHRVLFEEAPLGAAARRRVRILEDTYATYLAQLLSRMPDVDPEDAPLRARIVLDVLEATVHRWACDPHGEPIAREPLRDELARCIERYLAPSRKRVNRSSTVHSSTVHGSTVPSSTVPSSTVRSRAAFRSTLA